MMYCIVPLAGPDFYDEAYGIKPLFEINGQPLLKTALLSRSWYIKEELTDDNIIFVLKDTLKAREVEDLIITSFTGSKIVKISEFTKGALFSALAGASVINNLNVPIAVDLVDMLYRSDLSPSTIFKTAPDIDGILPYFCSDKDKYSYMDISDGYVTRTAEKKVISGNASAGTYFFRDYNVFLNTVRYSIENRKEVGVNDVFYVCPAFNGIIDSGRKVFPVEVNEVNELSLKFHK